jgi:hypothetical protein
VPAVAPVDGSYVQYFALNMFAVDCATRSSAYFLGTPLAPENPDIKIPPRIYILLLCRSCGRILHSTEKIFYKEFDARGVAIDQAEDGKYYKVIDISSIPNAYYIFGAVWKSNIRTPVRLEISAASSRLFLISDTAFTIPSGAAYTVRVYYGTITPSA